MGISQEEVRFGIVPGLADLVKTLSGAFGRSREREHQTQLAGIKSGAAIRAKTAKDLNQAEKDRADLFKNVESAAGKSLNIPNSVAKDAKINVDRGGVKSFSDPNDQGLAANQTSPDVDITGATDAQQKGSKISDVESQELEKLKEVRNFVTSLESLQGKVANRGENATPIVKGVDFLAGRLLDGTLSMENIRNPGFDGGPSIADLMQYGSNATDEASVAESQALVGQLSGVADMSPIEQAHADALRNSTAPPAFDEMPEIEAQFANRMVEIEATRADDAALNIPASQFVNESIPSDFEISNSESGAIDEAFKSVEESIAAQGVDLKDREVRQVLAQQRRDFAAMLSKGDSVFTASSKMFGAEFGRGVRAKTLANYTQSSEPLAKQQKTADKYSARATSLGMSSAQGEFYGQAMAATGLPSGVVAAAAKANPETFKELESQLRSGSGRADKVKPGQIDALVRLYAAGGLDRSGAGSSTEEVAFRIAQGFRDLDVPYDPASEQRRGGISTLAGPQPEPFTGSLNPESMFPPGFDPLRGAP